MSPNRLAHETSPYLLQHQDNPVDWHPWAPEALAKARDQDKPILLSVGYAACHWCHVMAHESFEDHDTARLMNDLFVNIKVDREERPDLDAIYQSALGLLGQPGGWPLTMFLTPSGEPFWGGTYFPPAPRYGRPAFSQVLSGVAAAYRGDPAKIRQNVDALRDGLSAAAFAAPAGPVTEAAVDRFARATLDLVDRTHGGIGHAPKFPQPGLLQLMAQVGLAAGDAMMLDAVWLSLDHMAQGGIYDHLGGGFARYATDEAWLVPHFEKMLYDNAQLVELLTLAWQATHRPLYAERVAETVTWVLRDMLAEGGAFAASVDADSEGEEGRFTVWRAAEIDALLDADTAQLFKQTYDVTPAGNWEGRTILHRDPRRPALDAEAEQRLSAARTVLWRHRERRVAPGRDDKVLTDWNGLMIHALAQAGFAFDRPDWIAAARIAFAAVVLAADDSHHRLAHAYRHGRRTPHGMLDDYAALARAALSLYEVTAEQAYLDHATAWVETVRRHYHDPDGPGYFFTADDACDVIVRTKTCLDSATPSGNGLMIQVLAKLYHLTGQTSYGEQAEALIAAFSGHLPQHFPAMAAYLLGAEQWLRPLHLTIVGDPSDPATARLHRAAAECAVPNRVLSLVASPHAVPPGSPASGQSPPDHRPAAYVCRAQTCAPPVTDAQALRRQLTPR